MKSFKQYLTEAKLKAEDYEAAIVVGFLTNNRREASPSDIGISEGVYNTITSNPAVMDAGRSIARYVQDHFGLTGKEKAEVFGRAKTNLTPFWASFGAKDTTPKTDILIGNKRLSLKIGLAQLMSGGRSESIATFNAALQNTPSIAGSPQVQKVESVLNEFVTNTLAPGQLRGIIKSGKNEVVNAAEKAHKMCMEELNTLFDSSTDFKIAFAREAMSGFMKYGEKNPAAAEFMLVSTHNGQRVNIHSVYDDGYCAKIADSMKLQARFKTASRKLQGKKTGEYNFWSVVSLIVDAMTESVDELNEREKTILNESVLGKIKDKVKSVFSNIYNKIRGVFTKGITSVMRFFQEEPEIKVKTEINF